MSGNVYNLIVSLKVKQVVFRDYEVVRFRIVQSSSPESSTDAIQTLSSSPVTLADSLSLDLL